MAAEGWSTLAPLRGFPDPSALPLPREGAPFLPASALVGEGDGSLFPPVPSLFPWLERAFAAGRVTALTGPPGPSEGLLSFLLAAALARGHTVSLRQGSLRFSPYALVEDLRRLGEGPEALERLQVARGFTVHQLVRLLEGWAEDWHEPLPALLVVTDLPTLFEDEDVAREERAALFHHAGDVLGRLLRALPRPLLLTGPPRIRELPLPWGEELRVAPGAAGSLLVRQVHWAQRAELSFHPPSHPPLERFETGGTPASVPWWEVPAWGGPSPPIGKP